jgi:hypothetical protein
VSDEVRKMKIEEIAHNLWAQEKLLVLEMVRVVRIGKIWPEELGRCDD